MALAGQTSATTAPQGQGVTGAATTAANVTTPAGGLCAGDIYQQLSALDIDQLLATLTSEHRRLPARWFYDVRTQQIDYDVAARDLAARIDNHGWQIVITHTRNHWATAFCGRNHTVILDSAASPATARDYHRIFNRLRRPQPVVLSHARQPRGSDECGLHPVLLTLLQGNRIEREDDPYIPPESLSVLDLKPWRDVLAKHLERGTAPTMDELLQLCEGVQRLLPEEYTPPPRLANDLPKDSTKHLSAGGSKRSVRFEENEVDPLTANIPNLSRVPMCDANPQMPGSMKPCGLSNHGNTCYMNAVMQCFANVPELMHWILKEKAKTPFISAARSVCRTIRGLAKEGDATKDLARLICGPEYHFVEGAQQDAQDFLTYLIQQMSIELIRETRGSLRIPDRVAETNDLAQRIGMYVRSSSPTAVTYQYEDHLSLPLCASLSESYEKLGTQTISDFRFPDGSRRPAKVQFEVHRPPHTLIIQLKRFDEQGTKLNSGTAFDDTFRLPTTSSPIEYSLVGFVVHLGNTQRSGHYIAYVRARNNKWFCADDKTVTSVTMSSLIRSQAYILWYVSSSGTTRRASLPTPTQNAPPQPATATEKRTRSHDPYAPVIAPEHRQGPDATGTPTTQSPEQQHPAQPLSRGPEAQHHLPPSENLSGIRKDMPVDKCSREKVLDGQCIWHHRRTVRRNEQCISQTARGPRCRHNSRAVTAPDGKSFIAAIDHCMFHATPRDQQDIRAALTGHTPDPPKHVESDRRRATYAMRHDEVRQLLKLRSPGDIVAVDLSMREMWPRSNCVGRIKALGSSTHPASVEVLARFCPSCSEWHQPDIDADLPVPSVDAIIYHVETLTELPYRDEDLTRDCAADEADDGSDLDVTSDCGDDDEHAREARAFVTDFDREPLGELSTVSPSATRAAIAQSWSLPQPTQRPSDTHRAAWSAIGTDATRREQLRWLWRLKKAPPELKHAPLGHAAVEIVLRLAAERKHRWSTIRSKLSSLASALRNLPVFCPGVAPIEMGNFPYFSAVASYASRKAKIQAIRPMRSRALLYDEYVRLRRNATGGAPLLLAATWFFAARTGDMRRLEPTNLEINLQKDCHGTCEAKALFTRGKGARWWGPYTIVTRLPEDIAIALAKHAEQNKQADNLFTATDQRILSQMIGQLDDASLRSIRRGALQWFSQAGASDRSVQLLSGHRNSQTLLRYLGWGGMSGEAALAASERAALVARQLPNVTGAGYPTPYPRVASVRQPRQGFTGDERGRRIPPDPTLFPIRAPQTSDLGLDTSAADDDRSTWPLHAHPDIHPITNLEDKVTRLVNDPSLRAATLHGLSYRGTKHLGVEGPPLHPRQIPKSGFTTEQFKTLHATDKAIPLRVNSDGTATAILPDGSCGLTCPMRSACKGFPTAQPSKRRLRPVFEPLHNRTTKGYPPLHYKSRRERRIKVARARYRIEFDFRAWFDQGDIEPSAQFYYVIRSRNPVLINGEYFEFFALTRVPMGASWAPAAMQHVTWSILEPLMSMEQIFIATMLDNVCICADDPSAFLNAVRIFLQRCAAFGAVLNDDHSTLSDEQLLQRCDATHHTENAPFVFLGEDYIGHTVRNAPSKIEKLQKAYTRLQRSIDDPTIVVTRRQVASIIGLATWCMHTVDIPLSRHFEVVRLFSRLESAGRWDDRLHIEVGMLNAIAPLIGELQRNEPVNPRHFSTPSLRAEDYAAIVIVDASATGLGAIVKTKDGRVTQMRRGWDRPMRHSAHAEPRAVIEVIKKLRTRIKGPIAIVSDHAALATGQRRPLTGNGGFSKAYWLNEAFHTLYDDEEEHQIFYVEGIKNPADSASRATSVGDTRWIEAVCPELLFPPLKAFHHPYLEDTRGHQPWHV